MGKVDAQMRDAVTRCMQSKALSDSIAAAVGAGLQVRKKTLLFMKFYRVSMVNPVLSTF